MQGRDVVIADAGGATLGEWDGIYGDPYSDLGVDMFGDIRLGDIPAPGPRAETPTSSNVVVQAVAQKVNKGEMKAPETTLTKSVPVVRAGITPKTGMRRISTIKAKKLLTIVGGVTLAYLVLRGLSKK